MGKRKHNYREEVIVLREKIRRLEAELARYRQPSASTLKRREKNPPSPSLSLREKKSSSLGFQQMQEYSAQYLRQDLTKTALLTVLLLSGLFLYWRWGERGLAFLAQFFN